MPPPTDHRSVPAIWHSFDLTHRRVQEGGWTHQVTQREIPESKEIAGVNMRLTRGSYRELHWHKADEMGDDAETYGARDVIEPGRLHLRR